MAFFNADDGAHAYFVSAVDLPHAKQILADARVQFHRADGALCDVHHPDVNHPAMWMEVDLRRAQALIIHGADDECLALLPVGKYVRVSRARRA